jgi:hypothetical protein
MTESFGIIGRCDNPFTATEIINFLKEIKGFQVIYIKRDPHNKLYIVDAQKMNELSEESLRKRREAHE